LDIVAIINLARNVEQEAPLLAGDLGLTAYEVGLMLRAPMPVIIMRSDDRARTLDMLSKLRSRGHDATACEAESVVSSMDMFRPRSFRFEGGDLIGIGRGEEHRLPLEDIFALVRAMHSTVVEDTVTNVERRLDFGRAMMSGGLLMTKATTSEAKKISSDREAVLYVFRNDAAPWLLASTELRYDGLGPEMERSQRENFEVLLKVLRRNAPSAAFDARLLAQRPATSTVVATSSKHFATSSSGTIDLLAHIVAISLGRAARPYR
jgi:hypothetical protein